MSDRAIGLLGIAATLIGTGALALWPPGLAGWALVTAGALLILYAAIDSVRGRAKPKQQPSRPQVSSAPEVYRQADPEETVELGPLDATPRYLSGLFESLTSLQAQAVVAPFLNREMVVEGIFQRCA